jgi:WD40 repeat protein
MPRVALLLVLLAARPAAASDLPPGALARLGGDQFRTGGPVAHLALSPDGTRVSTSTPAGVKAARLTVWDSATGRPVVARDVTGESFQGLVWGRDGGFAVARRADPNDFRVWSFPDPAAAAPPVRPPPAATDDRGGRTGEKYSDFILSGDGRRVAARWDSGTGTSAVHVFDLKPAASATALRRVAAIELGAEGADKVLFSADGKTIVTVRELAPPGPADPSRESVATVWAVATGKPAKPVRVRGRGWFVLAPDGRTLAVGSDDATEWGFDLVDLATGTGRKLVRWPFAPAASGDDNSADQVAFFPSGRVLAVSTSRKVILVDTPTGNELGRLEGHSAAVGAVAVSADGARIATGDNFGLVRLWDAKTLRPLDDAPGHRAPVEYAELSSDGTRLLTWADDEAAHVWDVATGKELRAFAGAAGVRKKGRDDRARPAFTPDGTTVLYSTKSRFLARDLQTGLEVPLPDGLAKLTPALAVFAPDGKALLTWEGGTRELAVWDWPGGKKRFAKPVADPKRFGFATDGSAVYPDAAGSQRWDARTGDELTPAWDREPTPLQVLHPTPRHLIDRTGDLPTVVEAGSGRQVAALWQTVAAGSSRVWNRASLSPDRRSFALAADDEPGVRLMETSTGQPRRALTGHRGFARVLGFTPDGTRLLTAGGDHTVLVWDVRLAHAPLPDALKRETSAAKLWDAVATGPADAAYLAMARFARDPDAAVKMARLRLKPAVKGGGETDAANVADGRAIELLEAIDTDDARAFLKELAGGHADAFRTREAKRARERNAAVTASTNR